MANLPEPAGSPGVPEMRAGDADRERVAQVLRDAAGEGRLTLEELDERLDAVYAAKTYADLEPITRDLPAPGTAAAPPVPESADGWRPVEGAPSWKTGIGVMSGFRRSGLWNAPRKFWAFAFWGGGRVDLRDARFEDPVTTVWAFAVMGGVEVFAPNDITVHVKGLGIMGGFEGRASGPGVPGSPTVVVKGFAFWGGVSVKRRKSSEQKRREKELKSAEGGPAVESGSEDDL